MKMRTKVATWLLVIAMVFSTAFVPASAAKVTVKKVTVASSLSGSKKTVVVAKGKSVKLTTTVTVTPNKKANKAVSYSVKNKKIATVSSKGVVKGKKTGTTKVTVASKKNKKKKATITIKVVKNAVISVKLNKSEASLNLGESLKLKATVKAGKGACKTIMYSTSNAGVAKVSSKGVITAVGVGSATITAKAIDGSGKKATCKVTVSNLVNLVGMDIPNQRTVTFTLDKACALDSSQVSIAKKEYEFGNYNKQLTINAMTTADSVNYTVTLPNKEEIQVGDFVQVTIPSLTGDLKSREMQYKEPECAFVEEEISEWTVGTYGTDSFSFGSGTGYCSYSLSGVPAGLSYEVKYNSLRVKGIPTTPGTYDYVLSAEDELGNTLTRTIHFIIGSDTVIAAAAEATYSLAGEEGSMLQSISVVGGSGSYNYSIISDSLGTSTLDTYNRVCMSTATPGVYTVVVRITDAEDASRAVDVNVVWNVKQGITVDGCIKDAQGNPFRNAKVCFLNKNRASRYCTKSMVWTDSSTGAYSAIVEPGVYDVKVVSTDSGFRADIQAEGAQSATYLYSQSFATSQTGYDIQLKDLYRVSLVSHETDLTFYRRWYVDQEFAGYGSNLYFKPGTYVLESEEVKLANKSVVSQVGDWWNGMTATYATSYKLTATFTVANAATQAVVSPVITSDSETKTYPPAKNTTDSIGLNESKKLSDSDFRAYRFTPQESGEYQFENGVNELRFYDMDHARISRQSEGFYLHAGTTYIVGCENYDDADVKIVKSDS